MSPDFARLMLDIFGIALLIVFGSQILLTAKAQGLSVRAIWRMTQVSAMGANLIAIIMIAMFSVGVIVCWGLLPTFLLAGIYAVLVSRVGLPPTVLFLGASYPTPMELAADVSISAFPLRTVHLLDTLQPDRPAASTSPLVLREVLAQSSVRVRADWERAVEALMIETPIIIVDARIMTKYVSLEIHRILKARLSDRSFLIVNPGFSALPFAKIQLEQAAFRCVTPDLLSAALHRFGWSVTGHRVHSVAQHLESRILNEMQHE